MILIVTKQHIFKSILKRISKEIYNKGFSIIPIIEALLIFIK